MQQAALGTGEISANVAGVQQAATASGQIRPALIRVTAYPISKQPFGKFLRALFNRPLKPIICSSRAGMLDGLARAAESKKGPATNR